MLRLIWRSPAASASFTIPPTDPEDRALLHFTSGTTGLPKGALHVHNALLTHYLTGKYVLDFHPGDIFWCTADPGWVTGTSYGIIAPLLHGITHIIDQAEFDAMWSQHVHHTEIFDTRVAYLNRSHEVAHKTVWNLRTPSYKDEYKDGFGGWHVERGQGPRPKGGIWLEVYPKRNGRKSHRRYELHAERTRE